MACQARSRRKFATVMSYFQDAVQNASFIRLLAGTPRLRGISHIAYTNTYTRPLSSWISPATSTNNYSQVKFAARCGPPASFYQRRIRLPGRGCVLYLIVKCTRLCFIPRRIVSSHKAFLWGNVAQSSLLAEFSNGPWGALYWMCNLPYLYT